MNNIFILDGQTDEVLGHINKKYVIDNEHEKDLPTHKDYFWFTVLADNKHAEHLNKRNGLIVPGEDGELLEFRIFESIKYRDNEGLKIEVHALATYLDLKNQKVFDPHKTNSETALQHADLALAGTEWQVGQVDFKGVKTLDFEGPFNAYEYLHRIARDFELELRFYIKTDGNKVTGRYVDLIERIGEFRGRTIEFGRDLQKIERKEDTSEVVTALWIYGPQREDGTRLKVFVEDDEARQRWGRRGQHIIDYYEPQTENQDITEERLKTLGEMELRKRINAVVTYEAEILDLENVPGMENKQIRFGDTIRIKDTKFNPPLYLEARVFNVKRDVFNKSKKTVQLGDYVEYTEEEVRAIWKQLQQQIQQKISQAELVEYAERKVQRDTIPPENTEHLWLDTSTEPNVLKRYDEVKADWVKATPTEADEVGAETPEGAQQKADEAKQEAISYSENFTTNYAQKRISSSTTPPENPEDGDLWLDPSTQPPTFRRWNAETGEWEKLSATTFEELEGMIDKSQLPDRVIDSMKLAIDAVQEENLAEDSVYAEAIQAEAVGAQAIAANAILAKHIAAGEVTANHLAADAVTANAIAAGAILAEHISANSIDSSKIATEGLNANVIKTGTLSAITLDGVDGTFSGDLTSETVTIGLESFSSYIEESSKLILKNPVRITDGVYEWGTPMEIVAGNNHFEIKAPHTVFFNNGIDAPVLHTRTIRTAVAHETLHDHGNGNVSISATNGDLYLGYQNTEYVRIGQPLRLMGYADIKASSDHVRIYPNIDILNHIRLRRSDGQVAFYQNGAFRHIFDPSGAKSGGSIEIDGKVWGMSPIDSPQAPIEYFIFDQEVTEEGVTISLDERFRKATEGTPYAVFTSGVGVVIEKGETSFTLRGEPQTVDIRIASLRHDYSDQFWVDMRQVDNEEGGDEQ